MQVRPGSSRMALQPLPVLCHSLSKAHPRRKALYINPALVVSKTLTNLLTITSSCFIVFLVLTAKENDLAGHAAICTYQALGWYAQVGETMTYY